MKILIVLTQTISCTTETYELTKGLCENGHEVSVLLSEHVENKLDWERSKSLFKDIYFIDTQVSKKNLVQKTFAFLFKGKKKLKKHYCNDIFDLTINTMSNYWDRMILKSIKTEQKIVYIHDPVAHSGTPLWKQILRYRRYKIADQIIVHTKSFIPVVHEKYKFPIDKIHYVPHGRLSSYIDCWERKPIDNKYLGKVNFLFFGTISKYKGLHLLAKAFDVVNQVLPNVTLTIAGKGDFSEYADEFSKFENVFVINRRILDSEIGQLFSLPNEIVVLPYLDATQSGVIITAMEFGVPIVSTDVGGLKEQLDDGRIGLLSKPNDADDFSEKMICLGTNQDLRKEEKLKMSNYIASLNNSSIAKLLVDEIFKYEKK